MDLHESTYLPHKSNYRYPLIELWSSVIESCNQKYIIYIMELLELPTEIRERLWISIIDWFMELHNSHVNFCTFCSQFCTCSEVIMGAMASLITGISIVGSTVALGADQRKHKSSGDRRIPHTKASKAENASIGWCHHGSDINRIQLWSSIYGTMEPHQSNYGDP